MKPWKYRPVDEDAWEDNWLSNSMAWASDKFMPNWCEREGHWTVKLTMFLWAECPCCHFFRGVSLGFLAGVLSILITAAIITM